MKDCCDAEEVVSSEYVLETRWTQSSGRREKYEKAILVAIIQDKASV